MKKKTLKKLKIATSILFAISWVLLTITFIFAQLKDSSLTQVFFALMTIPLYIASGMGIVLGFIEENNNE